MNNLRLVKISKSVGKEKEINILKNINLQFVQGKSYCIFGPSGCGKTSLLNIIANIDNNYEGEILFNGINIKEIENIEPKAYNRSVVNYIRQDNCLFDILTVQQNIHISHLDVDDNKKYKNDNNVRKLSGGQYKRVAIQQALNKKCEILLADEPTSNLDKAYSKGVMDSLKAYSVDKILIFVTHDIKVAEEYADEIIYMEDGKTKRNYKRKTKDQPYNLKMPQEITKKNIKKASKIFFIKNRKYTSLFNESLICLLTSLSILFSIYFGFRKYFQSQIQYSEDLTYVTLKLPNKMQSIDDNDIQILQETTGQINFKKKYIDNNSYACTFCGVEMEISGEILGIPNITYSEELQYDEIIIQLPLIYEPQLDEYFYPDKFEDIFEPGISTFSIHFIDESKTYKIIDVIFLDNINTIQLMHSDSYFYTSFYDNLTPHIWCLDELFVNDEFVDFINHSSKYFCLKNGNYYELYKAINTIINYDSLSKINTYFVPMLDENDYFVRYTDGLFYFDNINIDGLEDNVIYYMPYKRPLILGRYPEELKEIAISSELANKLNIHEPTNLQLTYNNTVSNFNVVGIFEEDGLYIHQNPEWVRNVNDSSTQSRQIKNKTFDAMFFIEPKNVRNLINSLSNEYPQANIFSPVYETITTLTTTINNILNIGLIFIGILLIITIFSVFLISKLELEEIEKPISHVETMGYDRNEFNPILFRVLSKRTILSFLLSQSFAILLVKVLNLMLVSELEINGNILNYNGLVLLLAAFISIITLLMTYLLTHFRKRKPKTI